MNLTSHFDFLSGHLSPAGVLKTEPIVFLVIMSLYLGSFLNTALAVTLPVGFSKHILPSGAGQPFHLTNSNPELAVAVSLADEKEAAHCLFATPH